MSVLTPTNTPRRHILGDLVVRHYTLTGTNGDTLVTSQTNIVHVSATPTTAIAVGVTVSGSTLTIVTVGAFTADFLVFSRVG